MTEQAPRSRVSLRSIIDKTTHEVTIDKCPNLAACRLIFVIEHFEPLLVIVEAEVPHKVDCPLRKTLKHVAISPCP